MALAWILLAALAGDDLQPTDAFLRAFVAGTATWEIQAEFHADFPLSPHKRQAEEYEAAVHCLLADERLGEVGRRALADVFLARLGDEGVPEEERARLLLVLARLRVATAVPALVAAARDESLRIAATGLEGLGFFGSRPAYDLQSQFAGKPVTVIFPPAPAPAATRALLALARDGEYPHRLDAVRALRSHDTEAVEAFAREIVVSERRSARSAGRDLLHALVRWRTVEILTAMTKEAEPSFRAVAARALGRKAERAAVVALLGLVADESREVRQASHAALHLLSPEWEECVGPMPEPDVARRAWTRVFGPEGERFDPERAIGRWPVTPGIYR